MIEIHTLWGIRKGLGDEYPEMMLAWDEYSIESNPNQWETEKAQAIASWEDELEAHREIIIRIDMDAVSAAFRPAEQSGTVITA
jgi:hypothetical protein